MSLVDILGYSAAILSTVSFVPQVLKTLKTRDTSGISLVMYSLFLAGITFWLVWGLVAQQWPAFWANLITVILAAIVFGLKLKAVVFNGEKV